MPRKKLQRFTEIQTFPNVLISKQEDTAQRLQDLFTSYCNITLEIGCGRGEHTIELAKKFPDQAYIGIDYQGERIWYGASAALEQNLPNACFFHIRAEELGEYFPQHSIHEIILPFSDPLPKKRQIKKRLTSPQFLQIYQHILKKNGRIHLKTDNTELFNFSEESILQYGAQILDKIEHVPLGIHEPILQVQSYYEFKHRSEGRNIYYLQFQFTDSSSSEFSAQ